jgi:hypothetical protein
MLNYNFKKSKHSTTTELRNKIPSLKLTINRVYKIQTRTMFRNIALCPKIYYVYTNNMTANMSICVSIKIKKNTVKYLANDGTGKHTHVATEICENLNCEVKKCPTLCENSKQIEIKGHNTHKPPIGRFCRFVSEIDANGNFSTQYFVPTNEKKSISSSQKASYENDIKPDSKQQSYIKKHADIYEDK